MLLWPHFVGQFKSALTPAKLNHYTLTICCPPSLVYWLLYIIVLSLLWVQYLLIVKIYKVKAQVVVTLVSWVCVEVHFFPFFYAIERMDWASSPGSCDINNMVNQNSTFFLSTLLKELTEKFVDGPDNLALLLTDYIKLHCRMSVSKATVFLFIFYFLFLLSFSSVHSLSVLSNKASACL